jgi:hypothetical protein
MQALNVVMNEKYKDDYNIHSKTCMNILYIFVTYVLHMNLWMSFIHLKIKPIQSKLFYYSHNKLTVSY